MRRISTLVLAFAVLGAGCGGSDGPDESVFAGLDSSVVAEVRENPAAKENLASASDGSRDSLAQGMTINFIVCRDAYRVYETWRTTGIASDLEPLPVPDNPKEPAYSDWKMVYEDLSRRVESGDIDSLRAWLAGAGSCGEWIPANPNDPSGPTIEDEIEGES